MPIESGPTGERKVRSLLLFLMVLAFAMWFAYDGWIGYPAENVKEQLAQLPPELREAAAKNLRFYDSVNHGNAQAAKRIAEKHPKDLATIKAGLQELYGGPPSAETKDAIFYFGPAYRVILPIEPPKASERLLGRFTEKSAISIFLQKGLAVLLLLVAVYLFFFVLHVRKTRLVLDHQGLSYRGRGPISWEAMKSLDIARFHRKGFVDLVYDDNGAPRQLRLDEYHLEKFDDVIDELCARKGFENPLPVNEEPPKQT